MKRSIRLSPCLILVLFLSCSLTVFSQSWSLTGNAGTNSASNFLGTTDNNPLILKTNNRQRIAVTATQYGGLEVGTSNASSHVNLFGKDVVDTILPLTINGNILNQTWGNSRGQTMGRLIRLNQGPSNSNGGVNWYDIGIGRDTCFFITNQSIPPYSGNGTIRKRMIVISPQDKVGINLASNDAIGTGAVPTANFHTNGTVRFQNLPAGAGQVLVIDSAGNIFRSTSTPDTTAINNNMAAELDNLKKEVAALKAVINTMKAGFVRIATAGEAATLLQNSPNPFRKSTVIKYAVPGSFQQGSLNVTDMNGKIVKSFNLAGQSNQSVTIPEGALTAGTYFYSLVIDGRTIDTKKMIIVR